MSSFFSLKRLKLKLRVPVTTVTVIVMTMTIPCSPMTRHLFATITVASTDKELCIDPSKCHGND